MQCPKDDLKTFVQESSGWEGAALNTQACYSGGVEGGLFCVGK